MAKEENNLKKVAVETAVDVVKDLTKEGVKEGVKSGLQVKKAKIDNLSKENLEKIKIDGEIQKKALDGIDDPEWKKEFLTKKHEDEMKSQKREQDIKIATRVVEGIIGGLGLLGIIVLKAIDLKYKNNDNNKFIDGNNVIEIEEENDNK